MIHAGLLALLLFWTWPSEARARTGQPVLDVDWATRTVQIEAIAQRGAFEASLPPDHQYHALVYAGGGAAGRSLFVTEAADTTLARIFREMGAEDGGGVPMAAWNLRWVPLVPQPDARVTGTVVAVSVSWGGRAPVPLASILQDPGGRGIEFRFGGNEEHDDHWHSGCILCLFSCPGGVISNAAYTIREHQRGRTRFWPTAEMPSDGTRVTLSFTLIDSS
jgi:hypothetical protein